MTSFTNGLLLAGLPILAFFGADYLLAPPPPTQIPVAATPVAVEQPARIASPRPADAGRISIAQGGGPAPAADSKAPAPAASALVVSIQNELKRVGCYAGDGDGVWNDRTKVAMQAFNSSVRVDLPTTKPDYILLTLLQGHNARACSRSCEGTLGVDGQCVDKSIEARTIAPATATATLTTAATTVPSAKAPSSPTFVQSSVRDLGGVNVKTAPRAPAPPASERIATADSTSTAAPVAEAVQLPGSAPSILPGRMAIGAPGAGASDAAAVVPRAIKTPQDTRARTRPAPVEARTKPRPRVARTFSDISSSAP